MKSKIMVGLACFALGIGAVLATQKLIDGRPKAAKSESSPLHAMRNVDPLLDQFYDDDFFGRSRDPFEEMRRMRERMMKDFDRPEAGGGGIFDSWYRKRFGGGNAGDIKRREDKAFIYYDIAIKDLDKDKLNVKVENGQISISGQIEKKSEENGAGSYFASAFHRSFPAPNEVDPNKVQIEQTKDLLTLKFPRVEAHG